MKNKCKIFKRGRKQAGITLVALVVTIVVLLILAGVSLSLVVSSDGIIGRAKEAQEKYGQASENEQNTLDKTSEDINAILEEKTTGGGSGTGSLPKKENGSSTPYLPSSEFSQVSGTNLDNGLVIEDGSGNQYVWIEVPKTADVYGADNLNITNFTDAELNTIKTKLMAYAEYSDKYPSDTWYDGCGVSQTNYPIMYNKMLESVYLNGGFWIGRYEIGDEEATIKTKTSTGSTGHTPVIKANKIPYTNITCSQAEELAETFAPSEYTSSLMFGLQWNLVIKFLETKGATQEELKGKTTGSTNWGNYYNADFTVTNTDAQYSENNGGSWENVPEQGYLKKNIRAGAILTTAAYSENSKMNIYDLAGNVWEWTLEKMYSDKPLTACGGAYYTYGYSDPVATHGYNITSGSSFAVGARVALY